MKINYKKQFDQNFDEWVRIANKSLNDANEMYRENAEKELKLKFDLQEKTLRHMEVVEKFLEIQTAIFKRLENKLK